MKKGEKMSDELKKKLSLAKIGKVFTAKHKANLSKSHLGKMPANIEMLRTYRKGRPLSEAHKNGIGAGNKGKVISKETRLKISIAGVGRPAWNKGLKGFMSGEKNSMWITDRSKLKKFNRQVGARHSDWVNACKNRDGKKCKLENKECGGQLEIHHIYRFSEFPDLRYDITNGITLCHKHHPRKKKDEIALQEVFLKLIS